MFFAYPPQSVIERIMFLLISQNLLSHLIQCRGHFDSEKISYLKEMGMQQQQVHYELKRVSDES